MGIKFRRLVAQIEALGGRAGGVGLETHAESGSRTLTAEKSFEPGEALVRVPFLAAINLRSALRRLAGDRRDGSRAKPVTKGGLRAFLAFCKSNQGVVSPEATITLVVALQILSEALDSESSLAQYVKLLPAPRPPARLAKTVRGPPMVHPLLFAAEALEETQNATLCAAVAKERHMLQFIYEGALCAESLTCEDFLWAVAIVRSRSLNLSLHGDVGGSGGGGAGSDGEELQCMLPVIDMADHSAEANCSIRCVMSKEEGSMVAIELFAQSAIDQGSAVTIDYGHRGLRDFFRVYGFTPGESECRSEIFEDASNPEAVFVNGHRKGTFFHLSRIMVVSSVLGLPASQLGAGEGGAGSGRGSGGGVDSILQRAFLETSFLLDRPEACSCLYEVEDESPHLHTITSFRECPRVLGGPDLAHALCNQPGEEERALARVLDFLRGLLGGMRTTVEEDERVLSGFCQQTSGDHNSAGDDNGDSFWDDVCTACVRYRLARKRLLMGVVDDLVATRVLTQCNNLN